MSIMRLWFLAVTAALGGFLFGFDTIVINGAEQDIQRLWSLSGQMHGWVVSSVGLYPFFERRISRNP